MILARTKQEVFGRLRQKRERSNFVLRAAKRIQNLSAGYDSDDEGMSWGMGGLGPNPGGGEEDDYGEEAEGWFGVIAGVKRRLGRWGGEVKMKGGRRHGKDMYEEEIHGDEMDVDEPTLERRLDRLEGKGLDDIDKSLLAERSDDELGDDESEGVSGEDSDVEME